jgi:hypothetical protein
VPRKERKLTKPADKAVAEEKVQDHKKETDKNDDQVMEDEEQHEGVALLVDLDFPKDEAIESIPPDLVPARRYNLNVPTPFPDGANSDDDFDLAQMSGSIYAAADSFTGMESDDFAPRRRLSDAAGERDDIREQAQLRQLQDAVTRLTIAKESAEREATNAMQQIEDLKHLLNSDIEDIVKDTESLGQEMTKLKEENQLLREELNDAQSHIFSLQPYRKDLTPEEVGRVSPQHLVFCTLLNSC